MNMYVYIHMSIHMYISLSIYISLYIRLPDGAVMGRTRVEQQDAEHGREVGERGGLEDAAVLQQDAEHAVGARVVGLGRRQPPPPGCRARRKRGGARKAVAKHSGGGCLGNRLQVPFVSIRMSFGFSTRQAGR